MLKQNIEKAWYGNIGGMVVVALISPLFIKRPALSGNSEAWIVAVGFIGVLLCVPAIIHFKKNIVGKHDFADDGVGLLQPMQAWSTLAFLPLVAGVFHYVKTGQLWFYAVAALASCILMFLFKPRRTNT